MSDCIEDEMGKLLELELEKVRYEDMLWSEMSENDRQRITEDREEFLEGLYDCDEEE